MTKLYRKCTSKPYSLLVIDTTLWSANTLPFRNALPYNEKSIESNYDNWWKIRDKNCDMTLIQKQQKYLHYHQVREINISIWQLNKYYLRNNTEYQKKTNLLIHHLERYLKKMKTIEKQKDKQRKAIEEHKENQSVIHN